MIDQWVEVVRNITETTHRLTGFEPHIDCIYRVRACNEFGVSDPTMPASYYGKPSTSVSVVDLQLQICLVSYVVVHLF